MYSKKKSKEIFDEGWDCRQLFRDEKLILIEDLDFAASFSGSDVHCIPIKFNSKGAAIGYDVKGAVVCDDWYICNGMIYEPFNKRAVAIAVSLEQLLWRTAPDWSKKNQRKHI